MRLEHSFWQWKAVCRTSSAHVSVVVRTQLALSPHSSTIPMSNCSGAKLVETGLRPVAMPLRLPRMKPVFFTELARTCFKNETVKRRNHIRFRRVSTTRVLAPSIRGSLQSVALATFPSTMPMRWMLSGCYRAPRVLFPQLSLRMLLQVSASGPARRFAKTAVPLLKVKVRLPLSLCRDAEIKTWTRHRSGSTWVMRLVK